MTHLLEGPLGYGEEEVEDEAEACPLNDPVEDDNRLPGSEDAVETRSTSHAKPQNESYFWNVASSFRSFQRMKQST